MLLVLLSGYANEVGEAFRSSVPVNAVRATYGVSICYVVADSIHKGNVAYKKVCAHCDCVCDFWHFFCTIRVTYIHTLGNVNINTFMCNQILYTRGSYIYRETEGVGSRLTCFFGI